MKEAKREFAGGRIKIGLVADTHEARDPGSLIQALAEQHCDFHVHLGDIGGSQTTSQLVHEYKRTLGNMDHLSPRERGRFEQLLSQGLSPIWAFIEMRMGEDQDARVQRTVETSASYATVIGAMVQLNRPYFLSGNIDRAMANADHVRPTFEQHGVSLITSPKLIDLGEQALILWPSMKPLTSQLDQRLEALACDWARELAAKSRVVILAHEQLFKGPVPEKYRSNAKQAGFEPLTVPYFEPNPTWRHLLGLFRSLPAHTEICFVHGHVHDPCCVIQAGAPYLKGSLEAGLAYRLYGLATARPQNNGGGRRAIRIFCVPSNEAMMLVLGGKHGTQHVTMQRV